MSELIENHYKENYNRILKRMAFRAGGIHQAEDIVQEAYARALKYHNNHKIDEFDKWFSMVLNNAFNDYMRDEIGLSYIEDDDEPLGLVECGLVTSQTRREVYDIISTKSVVQQEVLNLHLRQGYSPTDIANTTSHSYANVHKIIQRFKNELSTLYGVV